MEELRPCPFCGGEVQIVLTGEGLLNWLCIKGGYGIHNRACSCRLSLESERYFINCIESKEAKKRAYEGLIKAWNKRIYDKCKVVVSGGAITIDSVIVKEGIEEDGET